MRPRIGSRPRSRTFTGRTDRNCCAGCEKATLNTTTEPHGVMPGRLFCISTAPRIPIARRLPEHCELASYWRELGAWSDGGRRWFRPITSDKSCSPSWAAQQHGGRIDILINSGELCRAIPGSCSWSASCCDAMQEEFKLGDTLVLDRTNGAGMTIRYLLPRD